MSSEAPIVDPSGWESWTDEHHTMHVRITVTDRARRAMSARQLRDLQEGGDLVSRAFEPDEPAPYGQG